MMVLPRLVDGRVRPGAFACGCTVIVLMGCKGKSRCKTKVNR
jgi:hypothetical protein